MLVKHTKKKRELLNINIVARRVSCGITARVVRHLASKRERGKKMISLFNYIAQVIHHVRHIKINTTTENYRAAECCMRRCRRKLRVW